ncbi:unnamed protein product, partial [marine sediment metagenome]
SRPNQEYSNLMPGVGNNTGDGWHVVRGKLHYKVAALTGNQSLTEKPGE